MSFPLPPDPITWTEGQAVTAPELRADPGNLAWLLTKRPLFIGSQQALNQGVTGSTVTPVLLDTEYCDNWNGHAGTTATYTAQFAGWYLAEGVVFMTDDGTSGYYEAGIRRDQAGTVTTMACATLCSNGTSNPGPVAADLVQLDPFTSDTVALFAYQTVTGELEIPLSGVYFSVQWAGLPTSVPLGFGWINGTVVTGPAAAAEWPPGSGTLIMNSGGIDAGATSVTVGETTGMITGGTLGLDYYNGAAVSPMAESVTVTGITGGTVATTATNYPHGGTASPGNVAIPVSAAFMNQQVRDVINYLAYPPMARLTVAGTSQQFGPTTFPAGSAVTFTTATLDNFSGWNSGSEYVFPASGVYYVYGQVFIEAAVTNLSAGIAVSGGTIAWGDSIRNQVSQVACATVRKHIRVTAGQYVQLFCCNNSAGTVTLNSNSTSCSMLLVLWRGF